MIPGLGTIQALFGFLKGLMKVIGLFQEDLQEEKNRVDGMARHTAKSTEEIEAERQRKEAKKADVADDTDAELRARAKRLHSRKSSGRNPE